MAGGNIALDLLPETDHLQVAAFERRGSVLAHPLLPGETRCHGLSLRLQCGLLGAKVGGQCLQELRFARRQCRCHTGHEVIAHRCHGGLDLSLGCRAGLVQLPDTALD